MDMSDPKTLYAASYQRRRTSWGFNGGGPGSGIWKTTDAGKTWTKLQGSGLPEGLLGRIGLDSRTIEFECDLCADGSRREHRHRWRRTNAGSGDARLRRLRPARRRSARPHRIQSDPASGAQTIKAKRWRIVSNENNRPMYYSQIRVDPTNPENVYVGGLNFSKSTDGGKTFISMQANIGHVDNHAIWINPKNGNHILLGNDGGLNVTYDQGDSLGLHQHDRGGAVLCNWRRHAQALLRLRRLAG